jgi:hypothetical protein
MMAIARANPVIRVAFVMIMFGVFIAVLFGLLKASDVYERVGKKAEVVENRSVLDYAGLSCNGPPEIAGLSLDFLLEKARPLAANERFTPFAFMVPFYFTPASARKAKVFGFPPILSPSGQAGSPMRV